jgi:UDP-N-acetylmuramoyl-tripeptide--D-alanyl-D-alanine ligase
MEPMELFDVAQAIRGMLEGGERGARAQGASIDSRLVKPGDIFFALSGTRTDGSRFVGEAFRRGASAAVVAHGADLDGQYVPRSRVVRTADPVKALWDLAVYHRKRLQVPVVAVTGSCGKTTTRELIHKLLSAHLGPGIRSRANFNNHLGVPLTLLEVQNDHAFAVVEMGSNRPGEIESLARLARPRVGVVTNVRSAHLEGFGDLYGVAREKGSLLEAVAPQGVGVYNPGELGLSTIAMRSRVAALTFGASPRCSLCIESAHDTDRGLRARINGVDFLVPLNGARLAWNVAAAVAVGTAFGMSLAKASTILLDFAPPEGRLHRESCGGITLIDDAYNANPASMKAALEIVGAARDARRRVLVLGDMLELGKASLRAHTELGRDAACVKPDLTVSVGRHISATIGAMIARGVSPAKILHFEDADAASDAVPSLLSDGDVVLLKASRALRFEKIRNAIVSRFRSHAAATI